MCSELLVEQFYTNYGSVQYEFPFHQIPYLWPLSVISRMLLSTMRITMQIVLAQSAYTCSKLTDFA